MKTIQKEQVPAPVSTGLIEKLFSDIDTNIVAKLETRIFDALQVLICGQSVEEDWIGVTNRIQWGALEHAFLLDITMKTIGSPYGHVLVEKILSLDTFHYEDFEQILHEMKTVNLYTIEKIIEKIRESKAQDNESEKWESLAIRFLEKITGLSHKDTAVDWHQIMYKHDFKKMNYRFAIEVAMFACKHPCGHALLEQMILDRFIHLADLIAIAEKTIHKLDWCLKFAIWEAAKFSGCDDYGRCMLVRLYPQNRIGENYFVAWNGKVIPWQWQ